MPAHHAQGTILHERYRIDRVIGQGGYGFIYLAEDLRLSGRYCAVKEVSYDPSLPPELLQESREQFQREANVLARLDHPNLPKVSDYFSIEDRDYLVMDYVPGDDLRTLVSKAAQKGEYLEEEEVLDWARQIGDALEYLHNQEPPIGASGYQAFEPKIDPNGG